MKKNLKSDGRREIIMAAVMQKKERNKSSNGAIIIVSTYIKYCMYVYMRIRALCDGRECILGWIGWLVGRGKYK